MTRDDRDTRHRDTMSSPREHETLLAELDGMPDEHALEMLMMLAVDGELDETTGARLERLLERYPERRAELEDHITIKQETDVLRQRILADAQIEPPRESHGARNTIGLATSLVVAGAATLIGFGLYELFTDPEAPLAVQIGVGLGAFGLLTLLVHVVRLRWRRVGRDPYSEIDL